jgi:hypothetical protein
VTGAASRELAAPYPAADARSRVKVRNRFDFPIHQIDNCIFAVISPMLRCMGFGFSIASAKAVCSRLQALPP